MCRHSHLEGHARLQCHMSLSSGMIEMRSLMRSSWLHVHNDRLDSVQTHASGKNDKVPDDSHDFGVVLFKTQPRPQMSLLIPIKHDDPVQEAKASPLVHMHYCQAGMSCSAHSSFQHISQGSN